MKLQFQPRNQVAQQLRHQRIHHRGRLVVQDALGLRGQRTRNRYRPFHSCRKVRRQQVTHLLNTDHLQQAIHHLQDLLFGQFAPFAQWKSHIFANAQRIKQRSILKYHRDFLADQFQLWFGVVGDIFPRHDDAPRIRLQEPHDAVQRNRLSDTASTQDADHLSRQDIETHIVQNDAVPEGLGDVLELDVGFGGSVSHRQQHGMRGDPGSTVC